MLHRLLFTFDHVSSSWDWQEWVGAFACIYLTAFIFLTLFRTRH